MEQQWFWPTFFLSAVLFLTACFSFFALASLPLAAFGFWLSAGAWLEHRQIRNS